MSWELGSLELFLGDGGGSCENSTQRHTKGCKPERTDHMRKAFYPFMRYQICWLLPFPWPHARQTEWSRAGLLPRDSAPGAPGRTRLAKAVPHSVLTQVMNSSKWNPLDYYGNFLELNFWKYKCLHARALCYPCAFLCCCLCVWSWSHIAWISAACLISGSLGFGNSVTVCKKQRR